jgi:hypothetical protein
MTNFGYLFTAVAVGIGATFILDLWGWLLALAFKMTPPNYCLVGRWLLHMPAGRFAHEDIGAASAKPFECPTGWIAHYALGVIFALAFVALASAQWLQAPTLPPALAFGVITVVVPFFVMHPAFGLGVAASKTPNPNQGRLRSLAAHAVFGCGLYLSAIALRLLH